MKSDEPDEEGYVPFIVAAMAAGMQSQYLSRYLTGWNWGGTVTLDYGLRWHDRDASGGNYHAIRIHKDDVDEYVRRVQEIRNPFRWT